MISLGWSYFPIYNDNSFNENIGVDKDRISRGKKTKSKFRFIFNSLIIYFFDQFQKLLNILIKLILKYLFIFIFYIYILYFYFILFILYILFYIYIIYIILCYNLKKKFEYI